MFNLLKSHGWHYSLVATVLQLVRVTGAPEAMLNPPNPRFKTPNLEYVGVTAAPEAVLVEADGGLGAQAAVRQRCRIGALAPLQARQQLAAICKSHSRLNSAQCP